MKAKLSFLTLLLLASVAGAASGVTSVSQMERLTRGVVAIHKPDGGNLVSWRLLGNEPQDVRFDLFRDGALLESDLAVTCYADAAGTAGSRYQVVAKVDGRVTDTSAETATWEDIYKNVRLQRPASGTVEAYGKSTPYSYYPHDTEVADLDGDGDYELIVKWNPTNSHDNSVEGFTAPTIIDAYKVEFNVSTSVVDARLLWRVDLGRNIRSGSHYTQFLVYDFDGDGKAEMICKTAPGSVDGIGNYVNMAADDAEILGHDNAADYRNERGFILDGPEYLTVFNGETGAAVHTVWYNPNRGMATSGVAHYNDSWGDEYGNRGDRFLACVAYLDGAEATPSAVMCRGYYTRAYLWAVKYGNGKLSTQWRHASTSNSIVQVTDAVGKTTTNVLSGNTSGIGNSYTAYGQGNHNISVADVDGDGADEIIYGSATIDHDGSLLYSTGLGHGDALHVGDLLPDRDGLEVFTVHEYSPYGFDVHDAATGEIIYHVTGRDDTGRGMACDYISSRRGYEFWTSDTYDVYGNDLTVLSSTSDARPPISHRIYWNGEGRDQLLDGTNIYYSGSGSKSVQLAGYNNTATPGGSKAYPCLSADIMGDWREEIILFCDRDSASLNIFSTTERTDFRLPTLMHDHVYRMGVAWQNVAYNQPPHLGYYLPDSLGTRVFTDKSLWRQNVSLGESIDDIVGTAIRCTRYAPSRTILNGKVISYSGLAGSSGMGASFDEATGNFAITGTPAAIGTYQIVMKPVGDPMGINTVDTVTIVVSEPTGMVSIDKEAGEDANSLSQIYNLAGQRVSAGYRGIIVENRRKYIKL